MVGARFCPIHKKLEVETLMQSRGSTIRLKPFDHEMDKKTSKTHKHLFTHTLTMLSANKHMIGSIAFIFVILRRTKIPKQIFL